MYEFSKWEIFKIQVIMIVFSPFAFLLVNFFPKTADKLGQWLAQCGAREYRERMKEEEREKIDKCGAILP